jgi:hypothetical protein
MDHYLGIKEMNYQSPNRHRETVNTYCKVKETNLKRIPIICYSGKGKVMETVNGSVASRGLERRTEEG